MNNPVVGLQYPSLSLTRNTVPIKPYANPHQAFSAVSKAFKLVSKWLRNTINCASKRARNEYKWHGNFLLAAKKRSFLFIPVNAFWARTQSYMEYPDGLINLETVAPGGRSFIILRTLSAAEAQAVRPQFNLV